MTLSRRAALRHIAAAAPLATLLSDPLLAQTAAASLQPQQIRTAGGRTVSASLALPKAERAPAVLLVHEWWGLNDQIKSVAAELAREGMMALAVDLYDGKTTSNPDEAGKLMQAVNADAATDTLVSWIAWLKDHPRTTGKVATMGWCFGGGWALNAAVATPVDATVIYYGRVDLGEDRLKNLKGPVLGHFATRDGWITREMVDRFASRMAALGKPLTVYWYDADHAFANPTGGRYDAEDAALAWSRTLAFLQENI